MPNLDQNKHSEAFLSLAFHALADETRRQILAKLAESPAPIRILAAPFEMTPAAVGKHVRVLENAGLVTRQVVGRDHICALELSTLRSTGDWFETYKEYWTDSLQSLADYVETMYDS